MTHDTKKEMTVTREFEASRELVWDAWTKPAQFAKWFGFPLITPVETVAMDVRPGGVWQATMFNTDGTQLPFLGKYLEVVPPERLVMTFENPASPSDRNVETLTITLHQIDGKTRVVLHQAGHLPDEQYPKLVAGYTNFMNGMAKLFTTLL